MQASREQTHGRGPGDDSPLIDVAAMARGNQPAMATGIMEMSELPLTLDGDTASPLQIRAQHLMTIFNHNVNDELFNLKVTQLK